MRTRAKGLSMDSSEERPATRSQPSQSNITGEAAASGSLLGKPVPRRSAPKHNVAASVASLASRVTSHSEDDEDEDQEALERSQFRGQVEEEPSLAQASPNAQTDPQPQQGLDDMERFQIMTSLLDDFSTAIDSLHRRLDNGNYNDKVFTTILNNKRNAFRSLFNLYQRPNTQTLFIDPAWVQNFSRNREIDTQIPTVILRANIVNALDCIDQLNESRGGDPCYLLESIDFAFMRLFTSESGTQTYSKLALDLRTCYLTEMLASSKEKEKVKQMITSVFCEDTEGKDHARMISHGPFKSLISRNDAEKGEGEIELISSRASELYTITYTHKRDHGVGQMRNKYPLDQTLDRLKRHLLAWYIDLKDAERQGEQEPNGQTDTGRDSWHDAEETIPDSISESQPTMRPPEGIRGRSFFQGPKSLQDLQSLELPHRHSLPPSNQQQYSKAPTVAPSDYSQDDTRNLLREDAINSRGRKRQRMAANVESGDDDDDDDDDNAFEDDTRPVSDSRRQQLQDRAQAQAHKRPHLATLSREMPPPPTPSRVPISEILNRPPEANYEALRMRKNQVVASGRARQLSSQVRPTSSFPPTSSNTSTATTYASLSRPKQRHAWSQADTDLLTHLVAHEHAAWAKIEREHNDKFEHPRNQQAYRDKARNLKVDILLTDAVLPPGFDLVVLGQKEVDKLEALGKNPYRLESDVDERGDALNTEMGR